MQMAQQKHHADMLEAASKLGIDELTRRQATEDLQFAQLLHGTDMAQYQKDTAKAMRDLQVA